jgi:2'-5' RNA ligase
MRTNPRKAARQLLKDKIVALCVVNYPTISVEDYDWIQSIRREHDPLFFEVVEPHFTIVFPTDQIEESALVEHVSKIAAKVAPFEVVLRCATLGDPSFMEHAHAFLIPDEGFSRVVKLHDALYTGPLRSELRLDLPFVPHIGVANTPGVEDCKVLVDRINSNRFEIHGHVEKLSVIGYDGATTWTIQEYALMGVPPNRPSGIHCWRAPASRSGGAR